MHVPFCAMFGMEPRLPVDAEILPRLGKSRNIQFHLDDLAYRRNLAISMAKENIQKAQEKMKSRYDRKAHEHKFKVGDTVYLHHPAIKLGRSPKFHHAFRGPFRITEQTSPVNSKLEYVTGDKKYPKVIHANRLKHAKLRPEHLLPHDSSDDRDSDINSSENSHMSDREGDTNMTRYHLNSDTEYYSFTEDISDSLNSSSRQREWRNTVRQRAEKRKHRHITQSHDTSVSDISSNHSDDENHNKYYEVEKILRSRFKHGKPEFLVVWKGYPSRPRLYQK